MKTLYLDCSMGAAGDMLSAALLELLPNRRAMLSQLNTLGIPGVEYIAEPIQKCGITGTHLSILVHGAEEDSPSHHHHSSLRQLEELICQLALPKTVQRDILAVYQLIAQAESQVHGVAVSDIHFHEVGSLDALADVSAVCLMLYLLAPDRILASPVHVGSGTVRCAHGILPVPAPATALLLQGIPTYGGNTQGELCTPTGAALLKYFVHKFSPQPPMIAEKIGYGCGKKDFPQANCLRAIWGEGYADTSTQVLELSCNLDDITGEELGFAQERLLEAGALDVYTIAIGMKKSRPGILLRVLCRPEQRETMLELLFRHTSTLGIREASLSRHVLSRDFAEKETAFGPVRLKTAQGFGVRREKAEYEDLSRIAKAQNLSLQQVKELLK